MPNEAFNFDVIISYERHGTRCCYHELLRETIVLLHYNSGVYSALRAIYQQSVKKYHFPLLNSV